MDYMPSAFRSPCTEHTTRVPYTHTPTSRTTLYRKVTKPQLERRRRARVNKYLEQLKNIVASSNFTCKPDDTLMGKFEKADILEMTIQHVHCLRKFQVSHDPSEIYEDGFKKCANETFNYLKRRTEIDDNITERLSSYLRTCLPLSIDVPEFRLKFSSSSVPSPDASPHSQGNTVGLLMEVPKGGDEDYMWRPW